MASTGIIDNASELDAGGSGLKSQRPKATVHI